MMNYRSKFRLMTLFMVLAVFLLGASWGRSVDWQWLNQFQNVTVGGSSSGDLLTVGGAQAVSGKNFSQDGTITVTDTGSTVLETPLQLFTPNIQNAGTARFYLGKALTLNNALEFRYSHLSDGNTGNSVGIGFFNNSDILRILATGVVEINGTPISATTSPDTYVNNSNGNPNISDTPFEVAGTILPDTWESLGPTGSGAANIWTALDGVPLAATHVWVRIYHTVASDAAGNFAETFYARRNGSTQPRQSDTNGISFVGGTATAASQSDYSIITTPISVDASNMFNGYHARSNTDGGVSHVILTLVGYGFNP